MIPFLLATLLLALAIAALGVAVFFSRKREFPATHVGSNKAMRERGIRCVIEDDHQEQRKARCHECPGSCRENPLQGGPSSRL